MQNNRMGIDYVNHRSYYFLIENALGAMYQAYKESLDYSILFAMQQVREPPSTHSLTAGCRGRHA